MCTTPIAHLPRGWGGGGGSGNNLLFSTHLIPLSFFYCIYHLRHLSFFDFVAYVVPYILREQFDEQTEDIEPFHAYEHTYDMEIEIRLTRTRIGGEEWK
jgi:hypothetical protein